MWSSPFFVARKEKILCTEHLTEAEKWIFDNAEILVERFEKKESFIITKDHYQDSWKQELMRKLLDLKEIENVLYCDEGLQVFLY